MVGVMCFGVRGLEECLSCWMWLGMVVVEVGGAEGKAPAEGTSPCGLWFVPGVLVVEPLQGLIFLVGVYCNL